MEKFLTMPKLGMTMTEGTVLQWLHQEGDVIEKGEPILEVMTDKVNMEVEAPFTGRLIHVQAHDGDTLPIGAPLATLVDSTAEEGVTLPTVQEVSTLASPSLRIASTPAAKREAALHAIDLSTIVQNGATLPLDRADVLAFVQGQTASTTSDHKSTATLQRPARVSPVAQKIADEHQVDLMVLAQQKQGEKIKRADVETHIAVRQEQLLAETQPDVLTQTEESELIPLSPIRRLIGQRMQQSLTTAPHIYLDTEIDMTEA